MVLQTSLNLFSKELTEAETNFWLMLMDEWSVNEMRYAFDNWNRNGRFFPKPKDIIEQIEAYRLSVKGKYGHPTCDAQCRERHDKGYGAEDMLWLYNRYLAKKDSMPNRPMNDTEIDGLLDELDTKRGRKPAWRQANG
jgi:hypothetical protein